MIDFDHARKVMVDNQLRTAGITDRRLLVAMGEVPREKFVPAVRRTLAYIDEAQALGFGRWLGAPAPFARLVQLAAIEHNERVLDLGCGTGYSTAVLAHLSEHVVAAEDEPALTALARATLAEIGVANVSVVDGPLTTAAKGRGPYDVIVVEGTLADIPDALLAQLKPAGRLVVSVQRDGRPAVAHLFAKSGKGVAARAEFDAGLPPLAPAPNDQFIF